MFKAVQAVYAAGRGIALLPLPGIHAAPELMTGAPPKKPAVPKRKRQAFLTYMQFNESASPPMRRLWKLCAVHRFLLHDK